jgi:membrane-bound inhibitor of C-type lysozyme
MNLKTIKWNQVTPFSQAFAIVLFVAVFVLGFFLGQKYEFHAFLNGQKALRESMKAEQQGIFSDIVYDCVGKKTLEAIFHGDQVGLVLSDKRTLNLTHALSGSGARFTNSDESVVFWIKGATATLEEAGKTTYEECAVRPSQ